MDELITQDSFTSSTFDVPRTGQGDTTNETEIKLLKDVPARNRLVGKVVPKNRGLKREAQVGVLLQQAQKRATFSQT